MNRIWKIDSGVQSPTAYLNLADRLSQTWINRYTIVATYMAIKLTLFKHSAESAVREAYSAAVSNCQDVEKTANDLVNSQVYVAKGLNKAIVLGMQSGIQALDTTLQGIITAAESLLLFLIHLFLGTYICLFKLLVEGSSEVAIDAAEKFGDFVNTTLHDVTSTISTTVESFNKDLNKASSLVEKAASAFGDDITIPKLSLPALDKLNNLQIPSSFDQTLENINVSAAMNKAINSTENLIKLPFEFLKSIVDSELSALNVNSYAIPIPPLDRNMRFCGTGPNSTITRGQQDLTEAVDKIFHLIIIILVIVATVMIVISAATEFWSWNRLVSRAQDFATTIRRNPESMSDPIEMISAANSPLLTAISFRISSLSKRRSGATQIRWFLAYCCHTPALVCFALGVIGLLLVLLQYALLTSFRKAVPALSSDIGHVAKLTSAALESNAESWAGSANSQIAEHQNEINNKVFEWAEKGTTILNDTINGYMTEMKTVLNDTFGGTVLEKPVNGILNCVLFAKLEGVENGLTWVLNQAHVTFPRVNGDLTTLFDSSNTSDPAASKAAHARAVESELGSKATSASSKAIDDVLDMYQRSLKQEATLSTVFLGAWLLVVLIGIAKLVMRSYYERKASPQRAIHYRNRLDHDQSPPEYQSSPPVVEKVYEPGFKATEYPVTNAAQVQRPVFYHSTGRVQSLQAEYAYQ